VWVVSTTPRPLYPRENPGTHCVGGWVGPRAGLDVCEKSRLHRYSIPDRPARSQSLYRLSCRAHLLNYLRNYLLIYLLSYLHIYLLNYILIYLLSYLHSYLILIYLLSYLHSYLILIYLLVTYLLIYLLSYLID
jgi:hypothetical protein